MGGPLKLKGGEPLVKKKKKVKSSTSKELVRNESSAAAAAASGSSSAVDSTSKVPVDASGKTEAQRKFEEVQRKRLLEKAKKAAAKTHRERVEEFNAKLAAATDINDIPKVGPG